MSITDLIANHYRYDTDDYHYNAHFKIGLPIIPITMPMITIITPIIINIVICVITLTLQCPFERLDCLCNYHYNTYHFH